MSASTTKLHWESVYATKGPEQMSWTQSVPQTPLDFIASFGVSSDASIIDIGGGDSHLVDCLLDLGYNNLTVLDISATAIRKAQERLGARAAHVKWIESDILCFDPETQYDIWHDRAAFHFLTQPGQIAQYIETAQKAVRGYLTIATFSTEGPLKCSGLDIRQYSEDGLSKELEKGFRKIRCITENHTTPFNTTQNFLICGFKKKNHSEV